MTQHAPIPPAPPRSNEDYRWTWPKALEFLHALADCGKVAEAARVVGMTRQSAYRLRERSALVAEGWPLALAVGQERRAARARARVRRRKVTHSAARRAAQGDTSGQVYTSAQRKVTLCPDQVDNLPHRTGGFAPIGHSAAEIRLQGDALAANFFPSTVSTVSTSPPRPSATPLPSGG